MARTHKTRPVHMEDEMHAWVEGIAAADGLSKAKVLRMALSEGRKVLEKAPNIGELLTEDSYTRHEPGYAGPMSMLLSEDDLEWIAGVHEATGVSRSLVIRVAVRLGSHVVDMRREAAARVAA